MEAWLTRKSRDERAGAGPKLLRAGPGSVKEQIGTPEAQRVRERGLQSMRVRAEAVRDTAAARPEEVLARAKAAMKPGRMTTVKARLAQRAERMAAEAAAKAAAGTKGAGGIVGKVKGWFKEPAFSKGTWSMDTVGVIAQIAMMTMIAKAISGVVEKRIEVGQQERQAEMMERVMANAPSPSAEGMKYQMLLQTQGISPLAAIGGGQMTGGGMGEWGAQGQPQPQQGGERSDLTPNEVAVGG